LRKRVFKKLFAALLTLSLLLNSASPILRISYAQEATPDTAVTEETSQPAITEQQTDQSTAENSPEQEATVSETPTPTDVPTEEITPTPTKEVTPTDTQPVDNLSPPTDNPSATLTTPSEWTFENVELNKEYVSPQNSGVKLTFTKLPSPSGNIKIEEITLTEDQIKQTGSLSDKAYDITSDMKDGTFSYNLSLPIPESSKGKEVEVKFAEELSNIDSAEKVENTLTKTDTSVSVTGLDHFTIFVVVNPVPTGAPCVSAGASTGTGCYSTIQEAINAASNGDTINVTAGTYDEQIVIDGKDITLQGAGDTTVIQPSAPTILTSTYLFPAGNFWGGATTSTIVLVKNAGAVTLKDFKVDGINVSSLPTTGSPSRLVGVLYGVSSGIIDNVTVNNIKTTGYADRTYGIQVSGASTGTYSVEVKNSHVNDWARNGIVADGLNLTANINHNTLVGPGTISGQVPNGILFIGGASGNATSNAISGMHYNADPVSRSAGILVYGATTAGIVIDSNDVSDTDDGIDLSASSHNATVSTNNLHNNLEVGIQLENGTADNSITGNTIVNNTMAGIRFGGAGDPIPAEADTPPGAGNVANNNTITGNGKGVVNYDTDLEQIFDATNNWWGNASGPLDDKGLPGSPNYNNPLGTGNAVSSYVDYKPWYKDAAMTILSNTAPAVPTLVSPTDGAYVKPAGLILDWSDVTDPSTPITYYYKSSYSSAVGSNNALTSPIYTSGALTTSQIDASGSADHLYYWQVRACDGLGNCSDWSGPWQVTVDSVAPTLTQITPVSNPTNDATPNYIFSSDETGTISYGGDCSSATTTAVTGNNTVTFNALSDGTHSNCTITVTDPAGNPSDPLSVSTFTVDTQAPVSSFSSPVDGSFWNTSIDIQGSSTDVPDTTVDYVRLFYRESVEEDEDFVWIEIDTVENTEGDEPFNWNYSWEPADGEGIYDIMAEATDTAGNTEESPVVEEVTYDVTEPSVTDISISPDPTNHPPSILALATDLLSRIASAIFQVDDEAFSDPIDLPALDGVFDSLSENLFIDEDNTMPYPGEGLHTLYVGAYDFAGNFGYNFASFTVDTTAPTLESTETQDTNGNGKIDAIKLTFSENIDDSLLDSGNPDGWDIIDYDGEAIGTGEGENDSELLLAFDEGESFDTGATPVVTYTPFSGGGGPRSTHDAVGNELESYEASADDKALPVLLSAFTRDTDTNGQIDAIELTFSEDIDDDMLDDSEFADGDGWDVDGYSDEVIGTGENENDNILLLTFSESGNSDTGTTPNVSYTSSEDEDTSTHDMVGNELEDGEWFTSDGAPPLIPVADPPAGDYISDQSVTLTSSDDGGTGLEGIYYTTNGDTPDNSSTLHSGAITVDKDMTIKAIAYDNAGNPSDILTAIYGIAPVISEESSSSIGSTTTTITWTTDEPATSRVIYDTVSHTTAVSSGETPLDKYGYPSTTDEFDTSPKVTSHSVDLTGLNPETTYYYRTVSRASPEKISDEKSFATTVLLAEDVVPSGGTASTPSCGAVKPSGAPVLLSAVSNANNQVTLTWSKASDPVTYYLITYGTSSGSQTYGNPNVGGKDTTSYTVSGLSGDVTYYFKVRAGNDCMPGDFSNELSVFVPGPFISGPAAGFAPGVLGEATPSAELSPTSSPEKGVLGETPSEVTKGIQRNLALGFGLLVLGSLGLWFIIKLRKRNDENS